MIGTIAAGHGVAEKMLEKSIEEHCAGKRTRAYYTPSAEVHT
jgi:hypothetical protein